MSNNSRFREHVSGNFSPPTHTALSWDVSQKLKASQEEQVSAEVARNVTGWHRYFGLQYPVSGGNLALPSFYLALLS